MVPAVAQAIGTRKQYDYVTKVAQDRDIYNQTLAMLQLYKTKDVINNCVLDATIIAAYTLTKVENASQLKAKKE